MVEKEWQFPDKVPEIGKNRQKIIKSEDFVIEKKTLGRVKKRWVKFI